VARNDERRLEDLLGRRVLAPDGRFVGRIEEVAASQDGGEWIITEYHIGPQALLERVALRYFGWAWPARARGYVARWDQIDPWGPRDARLRCPVEELAATS
jgi:hypothetical protein